VATWSQCLRYLDQAQACHTLIENYGLALVVGASVLNRTGLYLYGHASYTIAEPLYVRALSIYEQELRPQHPNIASSLDNLAELYRAQGKYVEAEPLYQRALSIWEQELGANHPNTATSLNNLALLYYDQGKYAEAEPLYRRAFSIREQELGANHPDTASSLNNLAALYQEQGKYAEAEPLLQRVLTLREQAFGSEHPDTADSLWWLAVLSEQQQHSQEAKALYQRALSIYERTLGSEHPTTQSIQQGYTALLEAMNPRVAQRVLPQQQSGLRASFLVLSFSEGGGISNPLPKTSGRIERASEAALATCTSRCAIRGDQHYFCNTTGAVHFFARTTSVGRTTRGRLHG
jgi:tetratricopeptide (TPR) repeat protein